MTRRPTEPDARSLTVEIGELVLHGFSAHEAPAVADAVRAEIERALGETGLRGAVGDLRIERLDGGSLIVGRGQSAAVTGGAIGAAVARAVHAPTTGSAATASPHANPPFSQPDRSRSGH